MEIIGRVRYSHLLVSIASIHIRTTSTHQAITTVVTAVSPSAASTQVVPNGGKRKETTGATTIVQLPLAFVRSGSINLNDGKMYYVSERGYNWSRTARSSTYTYYLSLNPTDIAPSNSTYRWYGLPLRCLYPESKKSPIAWRLFEHISSQLIVGSQLALCSFELLLVYLTHVEIARIFEDFC